MAELELRGIPLWLVRDYLVEYGGRAAGEHRVEGDGWTVALEPMDDFTVGSLRVGQVRLVFGGDDAAIADLRAFLEPKLLRAGG